MKFVAGESFIVNAEESKTRLSCAVYGNVMNSTGSIIPLIWDSIENSYDLVLYSEQMTRFMIDIEEAMDLIERGLEVNGYNVIPNLKAFRVKDIFEIYADKFGLKYRIGEPRISEKLHEMMISSEEITRTFYNGNNNTYYMHYKNIYDRGIKEFTSDNVVLNRDELRQYLINKKFYAK